jgi:hypothetical protein
MMMVMAAMRMPTMIVIGSQKMAQKAVILATVMMGAAKACGFTTTMLRMAAVVMKRFAHSYSLHPMTTNDSSRVWLSVKSKAQDQWDLPHLF